MTSPAVADGAASGGRKSTTFAGASVFLSRNLVPREVFDAVHDALRLNGADVFLCADPGRAGPLDFHVISSSSHEKFADLRTKGCNLLGPQCILSCAKEHRLLPKQGYTCCLAMDGVKVLCSGFEKEEKAKIEQLVTAMGGLLQTRVSMDVNFVIVKNVLAAKYKWALNVLKKPVVSMNWLDQCWIEHRVVPHEPYRILPFTGLNICVTKLTADERKELEKIIVQNGGMYSAHLTRKCTHLVSNSPGGDKYIVAKRWGNIHIVQRRWVDQSVARRACLDESLYPVNENSTNFNDVKGSLKEQHFPEISSASASFQAFPATSVDDLVSTSSQNVPASFGDSSKMSTDVIDACSVPKTDEMKVDSHVAEDSEAEDDDLYLSNCRISLVGFMEKELSKLVTMIRKGGGSRHILLSEKLTHIIVGAPSEVEKKEVRRLAAWGVINLVKATWLEECNRAKKEVVVSSMHIASELLFSKESSCVSMDVSVDTCETKIAKSLPGIFHIPTTNDSCDKQLGKDSSSERKRARGNLENNMNNTRVATRSAKSTQRNEGTSVDEGRFEFQHNRTAGINESISKFQHNRVASIGESRSKHEACRFSNTFKGKTFCFSDSFPHDRRDQVVEWVRQGGGVMMDDRQSVMVDFLIKCHGLNSMSSDFSHATVVSTHWIRSCLEDGCLQDVGRHIIFSPLRCRIPFPGFEGFRFCVSQYEEKERVLLKNFCFTLGAKFTETLTKKVTHLLCKFTNGPKYEASNRKGIPTITAEWLFECVRQDAMVPFDQFQPKAPTSQDRDAGLCTVSQYPTQAANMVSRFASSQLLSESGVRINNSKDNSGNAAVNEETSPVVSKRTRVSGFDKVDGTPGNIGGTEECLDGNTVPDVADAIENLLAESSKTQDIQPPKSIFDPDHSIVGQARENSDSFGISRHWLNPPQKLESTPDTEVHQNSNTYYNFSETQSEPQVVGYEEDLTGRQKIIDRVRSQSSSAS